MNVCTYICIVKLEQALQSDKFTNQVQKATLNVLYTAWWIKTILSRELKEYGLTHEQYNVLRILKGKHPQQMCVKDVAGRMIEKSSNVPRIVDRLEIKKLVRRSNSSEDKRETLITLTSAGISVLESANKQVDEVFNSFISLSNKEAVDLNMLLEKARQGEVQV